MDKNRPLAAKKYAMAKKIVETPLMKQYMEMKRRHPDAILLFRVGDFYETFSTDAVDASRILGITLTRRANGAAASVELAGFPHHALDTYLPRLVRAGRRVAICEQLEDPKLTKKLVKRGITELITPGLNLSDSLLQARRNNFLGGICFGPKEIGMAFLDISTGEFLCAQGSRQYADKLMGAIGPAELVMMRGEKGRASSLVSSSCSLYELDDWIYTEQAANERLTSHFSTASLRGFGVDDMKLGVIAAGSLLYYLDATEHRRIAHITSLSRIDEDRYVRLDRFTVRNLEIVSSLGEGGKCLLDILDRTCCPPGARMLRRRLVMPLAHVDEINNRLDMVQILYDGEDLRAQLADILTDIGDPERIAARIGARRVGPRELLRLLQSLQAFDRLGTLLAGAGFPQLRKAAEGIDPLTELTRRLDTTLREDAPALISQGNAIADGVDEELDSLRDLLAHSNERLDQMLQQEIAATGINSLKRGYNSVFGYYFEVRNTYRDKAPAHWIRKQTLVGAERYITPELKELEQKILGAEERISAIESRIFADLVETAVRYIPAIMRDAQAAAGLDCDLSAAIVAIENRYVRPAIDDSLVLDITDGRHPVIECMLPPGELYVANSVRLDTEQQQVIIITGPNMSGKSALLRQTALIALMAQAGQFVPARAARIGVVDKIFTRVGASDNISRGESTFMVEMTEAAAILNNMSRRSLILFDELGRGTSTYDGISIARAIVENIHDNGACRPRTLFATHYHELNEMERDFARVVNYNVAVSETDGKVLFLRKLVKGGSAHSFGIHVARIAGIPPAIVRRADEILHGLEAAARKASENSDNSDNSEHFDSADSSGYCQASIFQLDDPLLSQIRDSILGLDIDNLTPIQALTTLHTLKSLLTGKPQA